MRLVPVLIVGLVVVCSRVAHAQEGVPAPVVVALPVLPATVTVPALRVTLFPAPDPNPFDVVMLDAATEELLAVLLRQASAPAPSQLAQVLLDAMNRQTATLSLDLVDATDLDVMVAVATFASQDARYQDIYPFSYFGQELATVRGQVAAGGMTPANKAALLGVYRDATAALKAFLATNPQ